MNNHRPTLCIVAGPNGSGKTSTTILLLKNEWTADSVYINPNNIARDVFGDWNSPDTVSIPQNWWRVTYCHNANVH